MQFIKIKSLEKSTEQRQGQMPFVWLTKVEYVSLHINQLIQLLHLLELLVMSSMGRPPLKEKIIAGRVFHE